MSALFDAGSASGGMIDLHLHTNASDGLLTPGELVRQASAAGLTTIAITDHDTVAGISAARTAARQTGIRVIPGIEITSVENERDVHILGYFLDVDNAALAELLRDQRHERVRRVREMGQRLRDLGLPVDVDSLLAATPAAAGASDGPYLRTRSWLLDTPPIAAMRSRACSGEGGQLSCRDAGCQELTWFA